MAIGTSSGSFLKHPTRRPRSFVPFVDEERRELQLKAIDARRRRRRRRSCSSLHRLPPPAAAPQAAALVLQLLEEHARRRLGAVEIERSTRARLEATERGAAIEEELVVTCKQSAAAPSLARSHVPRPRPPPRFSLSLSLSLSLSFKTHARIIPPRRSLSLTPLFRTPTL